MKFLNRLSWFAAAVAFVLLTPPAAQAMGDDNAGTAPKTAAVSKSEQKAVVASTPGVNVKGESGDFNTYVNDNEFPTDEEVRLMDVDPDSRVVLGGDEDSAGVAFKKSYTKSPIAE